MRPEKWPDDTSQSATTLAVRELVKSAGSYRKAAERLGVSHAATWNIAHERWQDVSRRTENRVRVALGLAALPPTVEVPACPDCNGVHTGRCHGKPVVVRPMRHHTWSRWADAPVSVLATAIRNRTVV